MRAPWRDQEAKPADESKPSGGAPIEEALAAEPAAEAKPSAEASVEEHPVEVLQPPNPGPRTPGTPPQLLAPFKSEIESMLDDLRGTSSPSTMEPYPQQTIKNS